MTVTESSPPSLMSARAIGTSLVLLPAPSAGITASTAVTLCPTSARTPDEEYVTATSPPATVNVRNRPSFGVGTPSTIAPPAELLQQPPSRFVQLFTVTATLLPSESGRRKRTT